MRLFKIFFNVFRRVRFQNKVIYGRYGKNNYFSPNSFLGDEAVIGNNCYVGNNSMIIYAEIGNYCSIAPNVIIAPANHPTDLVTTSNRILKQTKKTIYFKEKQLLETMCGLVQIAS